MKRLVLMGVLGLSITSQAENLYAYKQGGGVFVTNAKRGELFKIETKAFIHSKETTPPEIQSDILTDSLLSMHSQAKTDALASPDKKWSRYQKWHYVRKNSDFDEDIRMTLLLSNDDGRAGLFLAYNVLDKNQENPNFGIFLSNEPDEYTDDLDEDAHQVLCRSDCTVDINIDGVKYPNMEIRRINQYLLSFKYPNIMLEQFKGGKTIKIRLTSTNGNYLIYEFEPETILDFKMLQSL